MRNQLNATELTVLKAMAAAALDATGGDFGISDEVSVEGLTGHQLGGYMVALNRKKMVIFEEPHKINSGETVTQYTLTAEGWRLSGHPEHAEVESPELSNKSTNWGVMENVAAIAFHMGDSNLWEDAYKAAANHMGGSVGLYQAAVEMGVSLEEYSKKHKISWGSGADWISTIEVLPEKLLGFMIETRGLPDERERVMLIKASIQE